MAAQVALKLSLLSLKTIIVIFFDKVKVLFLFA